MQRLPHKHTHTHIQMHICTHNYVINEAACRHSVTDCRRLAGHQARERESLPFRARLRPIQFLPPSDKRLPHCWQLSFCFWHRHRHRQRQRQRQRSVPYCLRCFISIGCFIRFAVINLAACSHNYLFSIVHVMRLWFLVAKLFINLIIVVGADVAAAALLLLLLLSSSRSPTPQHWSRNF